DGTRRLGELRRQLAIHHGNDQVEPSLASLALASHRVKISKITAVGRGDGESDVERQVDAGPAEECGDKNRDGSDDEQQRSPHEFFLGFFRHNACVETNYSLLRD